MNSFSFSDLLVEDCPPKWAFTKFVAHLIWIIASVSIICYVWTCEANALNGVFMVFGMGSFISLCFYTINRTKQFEQIHHPWTYLYWWSIFRYGVGPELRRLLHDALILACESRDDVVVVPCNSNDDDFLPMRCTFNYAENCYTALPEIDVQIFLERGKLEITLTLAPGHLIPISMCVRYVAGFRDRADKVHRLMRSEIKRLMKFNYHDRDTWRRFTSYVTDMLD